MASNSLFGELAQDYNDQQVKVFHTVHRQWRITGLQVASSAIQPERLRIPPIKYRCYFLTTEGKVGLSFLVDSATPHAAAAEVLARSDGHSFPALEIWEGSTCVLSLDGAKVHTPLANPEQTQATDQGTDKVKVLVVDDDPSIRLFKAQLLREQGYFVYETASGEGAMNLLSRGVEVDGLVTDVRMPDMSGFELANRIAAERPSVKVLYTTAYALEPGEVRMQRPGSDLLRKPFTPAQLAEAAKRVFGG